MSETDDLSYEADVSSSSQWELRSSTTPLVTCPWVRLELAAVVVAAADLLPLVSTFSAPSQHLLPLVSTPSVVSGWSGIEAEPVCPVNTSDVYRELKTEQRGSKMGQREKLGPSKLPCISPQPSVSLFHASSSCGARGATFSPKYHPSSRPSLTVPAQQPLSNRAPLSSRANACWSALSGRGEKSFHRTQSGNHPLSSASSRMHAAQGTCQQAAMPSFLRKGSGVRPQAMLQASVPSAPRPLKTKPLPHGGILCPSTQTSQLIRQQPFSSSGPSRGLNHNDLRSDGCPDIGQQPGRKVSQNLPRATGYRKVRADPSSSAAYSTPNHHIIEPARHLADRGIKASSWSNS